MRQLQFCNILTELRETEQDCATSCREPQTLSSMTPQYPDASIEQLIHSITLREDTFL